MILEATAESWDVTMEMVWLDSRCWGVRSVSRATFGERARAKGELGYTYLKRLANTENNTQSTIQRGFRLTRNKLHPPHSH